MATDPEQPTLVEQLTIERLVVTDVEVLDVLARYPEEDRDSVIQHMLSVGARGLRSMGLSVGLDDIDGSIRRSFASAAADAQRELAATLETIVEQAQHQLDPTRLDSPAAQTLAQLERWRDDLTADLDPTHPDSSPARMLKRLDQTIGAEGELEGRLRALLDPHGEDSAVAGLAMVFTKRIAEVRDLIIEERGRRLEARRGTSKGVAFEDALVDLLREAAAPHGWLVEHTGSVTGSLHGNAKVGDFVVHLGDDRRIVIEAKKSARVALTGADGILAELDRAMANRSAEFSICVSAEAAFPKEVGVFGVYGNRILVVDDGDGAMLGVALRWARLTLAAHADSGSRSELDRELIGDRLQRLRNLAKRFSGTKRSLTQISSSVDDVRQTLDAIRLEVLDHLNDLESHLLERPSNVVQLAPVEAR